MVPANPGAHGIVNGLGFGGFTIPAMVTVGQGRGILYTFGNPTYGYGPLERIGVPTTVPLLAAFLAVCVVQVVGGYCCCGRVARGSSSRSRECCSARRFGGGSIYRSPGSTRHCCSRSWCWRGQCGTGQPGPIDLTARCSAHDRRRRVAA